MLAVGVAYPDQPVVTHIITSGKALAEGCFCPDRADFCSLIFKMSSNVMHKMLFRASFIGCSTANRFDRMRLPNMRRRGGVYRQSWPLLRSLAECSWSSDHCRHDQTQKLAAGF
jgi:hypothetical protein